MKKQLLSLFAFTALVITASAQPNSGMETWSTSTGEAQQPTGWVSYNVFTSPLVDPSATNPTSVTQAASPLNYFGTYSAKITTIDLVTNPASATLPNRAGILMAGSIMFTSPYIRAGYPYTSRPQTMSYAAKYNSVNGDSAYAFVMVTKWNTVTMSRDTIAAGYDVIITTLPTYQVRTISLVYDPNFSTLIPDTAQIFFSSSSAFSPQLGSNLLVDELHFVGYVGVTESTMNTGVNVYPNPSSTLTNFEVPSDEAYQVVISDITGREVSRLMITNKSAKLNSYTMTAGVYTYSVITKDNEVMSRGKFSVAQ
ncbi:MAG: T9SS type A sorting domain-containing protein [Bacteroidia bacterium]